MSAQFYAQQRMIFLYKDLGPLARSETVDEVNLSC
jgi:hypothetical protein